MESKAAPQKVSKTESSLEDLKILMRTRYPIIYVVSNEAETKVLREIDNICQNGTKAGKYKKNMRIWDTVRGLSKMSFDQHIEVKTIKGEIKAPNQILDEIISDDMSQDLDQGRGVVYVLSEFHHYLKDPTVIRRLRNFCEYTAERQHKTIIMLSTKNNGVGSGKYLPPELENIIQIFEWPYPDSVYIDKLITQRTIPLANKVLQRDNMAAVNYPREEVEKIIDACKGMTSAQIEKAATKSLVVSNKLDFKIINKEKKQIIKNSGICDYVETSESLLDIGGNENLKKWIRERQSILSEEAHLFGCDLPNGVMLIGPWGSGKSSASKAIISEWNLPAIRIDAGKIFDGLVGASEKNISSILRLAEFISPCILWYDECDNFFSGDDSSSFTDGGTTSRVIGIISTWMSEHEGLVFNIFTANNISKRPPKLFRKGRLDEIFIVDLPVKEEREEIFKIHTSRVLNKQGKASQLKKIDFKELAEHSFNFSGAEIRSSVNSATIECYNAGRRNLDTKDILKSIKGTVPMAVTMKEQIEEIRKWNDGRAIRASIFDPEPIGKEKMTKIDEDHVSMADPEF